MKQIAVLAFALIATSALADTAPAAATYQIAMTVSTAGSTSTPRVQVKEGEPFKIAMDDKGIRFTASFVLTKAGKDTVKLAGAVECGNAKPAHPVLITGLGATATVKLEEAGKPGCELGMVVSQL